MSDYKHCPKCKLDKEKSNFPKDARTRSGLHGHCKECNRDRYKRYYQKNKEEILAKNREWSNKNKEYHRKINKENCRKRYLEDPYFWREYYEANKKRYTARSAKRRDALRNACPPWYEQDVIKLFYEVAGHLGLEVDHIVPLQNTLVCGLHCIDNLQMLPRQANRSKSNKLLEELL